jgi:hypothetical protein
MMPALITLSALPFGSEFMGVKMVVADINVGLLFMFAISSVGVYGIVLAGWASNSKYPFLGGIRSTSQMISYELCMGLSAVPVLLVGAAMDKLLQHPLEDVATASQAPLGLKPIDPIQQFCAQLQADAPPGLVTLLDHGDVLTAAAYRPPRDLITNCWFSRACW